MAKEPNRPFRFYLTTVLLSIILAACSGDAPAPGEGGDAVSEAQSVEPADPDGRPLPSFENDDRSLSQKIQDRSLSTRIRLALVEHRELRAFDLEPIAVDGHVWLRGEVDTREQREHAEVVAAAIDGVRSVTNEITSVEMPAVAEAAGSPPGGARDTTPSEPPADGGDPARSDEASGAPNDAAGEQEATYHTVRSGDNLWDIARAYGVSIDQIRRLNGLSGNSIRPGQRLQVR